MKALSLGRLARPDIVKAINARMRMVLHLRDRGVAARVRMPEIPEELLELVERAEQAQQLRQQLAQGQLQSASASTARLLSQNRSQSAQSQKPY